MLGLSSGLIQKQSATGLGFSAPTAASASLDLYGAPDGLNGAAELDSGTIASRLEHPPMMLLDVGVDHLPAKA